MLIDTHCHLNFQAFGPTSPEASLGINQVIERAEKAGVEKIVVPGTDLATSKKAVELAENHGAIFAAVGIHPHHLYDLAKEKPNPKQDYLGELRQLLVKPKVIAVGEVGLDKYEYQVTKYENYQITPEFMAAQEKLLVGQINLAIEFGKTLILHNRQAVDETLRLFEAHWDKRLEGRAVFHCCEADERLLEFAKQKKLFIGIDGDITWSKKKQRFINSVPLEMLVLETDAPYLTPEPAKVEDTVNEPKNLTIIRDYVARAKTVLPEVIEEQTYDNSLKLFAFSG